MRRSPPIFPAFGLVLALAAAGRLAAVPLPLPGDLPLDALPLTVELDRAEVAMVVGDGSGHRLRARTARPPDDADARPALDVTRDQGRLTVRRADDENGETPRLRLDLVVAAGQQVRLAGRDLVVRIEDLPPDDKDTGGEGEPRPPAVFHLALESSEATLVGVLDATVELTSSSAWLDGSGGDLVLNLDGGSAEVRGHVGELKLQATGAEVTVRDLDGALVPRLAGGRLEVSGGLGTLFGAAEDAVLAIDDWSGRVELRGEGGSLSARAERGGEARWKLEGRELEVVLEQLDGRVEADLGGGSLTAGGLSGELHAKARGSRLELEGVRGQVELILEDGAEARVREVTGGLTAEMTDSRLDAEGIGQLKLNAVRSQASIRRVARVGKLAASDPELELDLREVLHDPSVELAGSGRARVWLPAPCVVRVAGPEGLLGYAIEVTNCELRGPGHRVTRRQDHVKYGAGKPTVLRVATSPDVELEVEGGP